jgi:hypothetical protein
MRTEGSRAFREASPPLGRRRSDPYYSFVTDRLTLAHALEDAGITRDKAEHVASTIFDAIQDNVARKSDLRELGQELRSEIHALGQELRSETHALGQELRLEMARMEQRLTRRGIGAAVVMVTIILAAMRYLGHG